MGQKIKLWSNGEQFEVEGLGYQSPKAIPLPELCAGEVGYIYANIKNVADAKIGDTITDAENPAAEPLPGFEEIKPMVFAGLYPVESHEHGLLRDALEKLRLNDSAMSFEPENSVALGFGFRCGFLGLLHLEIVQERLEREFNIDLITTAPGVRYRITNTKGEILEVDNPTQFPESDRDQEDRRADHRRDGDHARGIHRRHSGADGRQARRAEEVRIHRLGARDAAVRDAAERNRARFLRPAEERFARLCVARLPSGGLPRFADGAAGRADCGRAGGCAFDDRAPRFRLRARQDPDRAHAQADSAADVRDCAAGGDRRRRSSRAKRFRRMRKNVLAKCYGGDISRKRKLLEKQKEGKKRMKRVGRVDIPQEAFLAVLKVGDTDDDD